MARVLYYDKESKGLFVRELIIWEVPLSNGFPQGLKYRFVLIHKGERVLGYDNKFGEGNHKHFRGKKIAVEISSKDEIFNLLGAFLVESRSVMEFMGGKID